MSEHRRGRPTASALYFKARRRRRPPTKRRARRRETTSTRYDENYKQTHLWKVTVASKAETRITDGDFSVTDYDLSEDGRKIDATSARRRRCSATATDERGVGGERRRHQRRAADEEHRPGDRRGDLARQLAGAVPLGIERALRDLLQRPAVRRARRRRRGARGRRRERAVDVDRAIWSKDGKSIYFLANLGVHEELFVVPAAGGKPRQLTDGKHNIGAIGRSRRRPVRVHDQRLDAAPATSGRCAPATPRRSRSRTSSTTWRATSSSGARKRSSGRAPTASTVEGIVTYPVDYQAGPEVSARGDDARRTAGGRQVQHRLDRRTRSRCSPARATSCLQPNYRGSTGYGDAFLRDMVGHYFQNAHLDVMAGVDELIRRGIADPDRMVKMGWSARRPHDEQDHHVHRSLQGGVVRRRRRRKWMSMYAQSDIRSYRTPWFGGTPWQKNAPIDAYWNNSPLKDVANVKTPTLFFVGETRSARADAAVDRDVPRAEEQRRPDAPLRRAARAARLGRAAASAVQAERRDRVVREVRDQAAVHAGEGAGRREERRRRPAPISSSDGS